MLLQNNSVKLISVYNNTLFFLYWNILLFSTFFKTIIFVDGIIEHFTVCTGRIGHLIWLIEMGQAWILKEWSLNIIINHLSLKKTQRMIKWYSFSKGPLVWSFNFPKRFHFAAHPFSNKSQMLKCVRTNMWQTR